MICDVAHIQTCRPLRRIGITFILLASHTGHLDIGLFFVANGCDVNNDCNNIDEAHQKHKSHIKKCFSLP